MKLKRNQRLTESDWAKLILECERSQEKISDFCARKQIGYKCFINWRSRLSKAKVKQDIQALAFSEASLELPGKVKCSPKQSKGEVELHIGKRLRLLFSIELLPEVLSKVTSTLD